MKPPYPKLRLLLPAIAAAACLPLCAQITPLRVSPLAGGYLERARIMLAQGNYSGVIDQLRHLDTQGLQLPDAEREESAYMLAMALYNRGDAECVRALREFARNYPASERAMSASLAAADYFFFAHHFGNALAAYNEIDYQRIPPGELPLYRYRKALSMVRSGHAADAVPILEGLKANPHFNLAAVYYLAYIDYDKGYWESARNGFEDVAQRLGDDTDGELVPDFYLAQIDYAQGRYKEAAQLGAKLLQGVVPSELEADTKRITGLSLFKTGDYDAALPLLRSYMTHTEIDPAADAIYALGVMNYAEGDIEMASRRFAQLTDLDNDLAQSAYLYLGQIAVREGDSNAAAMSFEKASRMDFDPDVTEAALFNYVAARTNGGNIPFSSSIPLLSGFLTRFPGSRFAPQVRSYLATAYYHEKDYARALESINQIPAPDAATLAAKQKILYELGMQAMNRNEATRARQYLSEGTAIKGDPALRAQMQLWLGDADYSLGRYREAETAYREYLRQDRRGVNTPLAMYDLAYALLMQDRYADAAKAFAAVLSEDALPAPLQHDARIRLADSQYYAGDYRSATANYQKAIDDGAADSDYAWFRRAVMLGLGGDLGGKLNALAQMPKMYPGSKWLAQALLEKGQTHEALGETDKAVAAFEELRRTHDRSAQARKGMLSLALAYAKRGDTEKAVEAYRETIKRWPASDEARMANEDLRRHYAANGGVQEYAAFLAAIDGAPKLDADEMERLTFEAAETAYAAKVTDTERLERYVQEYPDGQYLAQALLDIATGRDENNDTKGALEAIDRLLTRRPSAPQVPEALSLKAQMLEEDPAARKEALETYRMLERSGGAEYAAEAYAGIMRSTDDDRERLRYAALVKNSGGLTPDMLDEANYHEATALLHGSNPAQGVEALRALAANPKGVYGARAAVELGEYLLGQGDVNGADKVLTAFTDEGSPHQYWLARGFIALADVCHTRSKDYLAVEYLRSLRDNYPGKELDIHDMIATRLKQWKQ